MVTCVQFLDDAVCISFSSRKSMHPTILASVSGKLEGRLGS